MIAPEQMTLDLPPPPKVAKLAFAEAVERSATIMDRLDAVLRAAGDEAEVLDILLELDQIVTDADDDSARCRWDFRKKLAHEFRTMDGEEPSWGRAASYETEIDGVKTRVDVDPVYALVLSKRAIVAHQDFCFRIVEKDKPFISESGFRSFSGAQLIYGMTLRERIESSFRSLMYREIGKGAKAKRVSALVKYDPDYG